jgi:hypothetical protein
MNMGTVRMHTVLNLSGVFFNDASIKARFGVSRFTASRAKSPCSNKFGPIKK